MPGGNGRDGSVAVTAVVRPLLPRQHRHAGLWVLIEAGSRLLAIGESQYHGISPRSVLDHVARYALLPRVRHCVLNGSGSVSTVRVKDRPWLVRVEPVRSPDSGTVLAVLGCYVAQGTPMPPPPLVGTWEASVRSVAGQRDSRTVWSDELPQVCGSDPRRSAKIEDGNRHDGLEWLCQLMAPSDRAEMRRKIDSGRDTEDDSLLLHTATLRGTHIRQESALRIAHRRLPANGPGIRFAGLAYRVPHRGSRSAAGPLLDAVLEVSRDLLLVVDSRDECVYLTSRAFTALPLAVPASAHLPSMCHGDDAQAVRELIRSCAHDQHAHAGATIAVRLATIDGGWMTVTLTGTAVSPHDKNTPADLLCRVEPVSTSGEAGP